jgi:hypothetical protein
MTLHRAIEEVFGPHLERAVAQCRSSVCFIRSGSLRRTFGRRKIAGEVQGYLDFSANQGRA